MRLKGIYSCRGWWDAADYLVKNTLLDFRVVLREGIPLSIQAPNLKTNNLLSVPDERGHFGPYGGMFVPETLMTALKDLSAEYALAKEDPEFQRELSGLLADFAGRPTPLYFAERLTSHLGGARIFLKREDLLHTGAHKINNALG